jgi:hypothetical protein
VIAGEKEMSMGECGKCGALLDVRPSAVTSLLCEPCAQAEAWVIDLRDKSGHDQESRLKQETVRSG